MITIGDIYIYVSDFAAALRFWVDGLEMTVVEKEVSQGVSFALLEFADGGPAIRLFSGAQPWPDGTRPEVGTRPAVHFDIIAADFDAVLVRLLEHGGHQLGEIESYNNCRVVTIADPDGNAFELLEVPPDQE